MTDLRITDAPEVATITGDEKIPTGNSGGNFAISVDSLAQYVKDSKDLQSGAEVEAAVAPVEMEIATHVADLENPHEVTKEQVGLGNVDNTADTDKPISSAVAAAITTLTTNKADKTYVDSQLALKANQLTTYTKTDVDNLLETKANQSTTYTKTEVNTFLTNKQDRLSVDGTLTGSRSFDTVPKLDGLDGNPSPIMNQQAQALMNRTENLRYDFKTGLNYFDLVYATSIGGYPLNSRLALSNGDVVKSTIPSNSNNPNADMTGWVLDNAASQIIDESGKTQQEINNLQAETNRSKLVSVFDFMTIPQFNEWKANQTTYNVTFALQAALDAPDVYEVLLPQGTYLHSGLVCDKNNFRFYSNGYARSILLSDNTPHVAIHVAKNVASVSGFFLDGVKLLGNSNTLCGIQLGDATKAVQFCNLNNCMIDGFTKSDACDIYLGSVQEIDIVNTMSWRGNIGIYRPTGGYGTSVKISGKAGYLGRHAKHGIKLDGQIDDIYVQDNVIEGNGLEGIYISDTAFKNTQGVTLHLQNAYMEANGNSGVGAGVVFVKGTSEYLKLHRIYSHGCNFADNPNAPAGFKNFAGQYAMLSVSGSSNLLPNQIGLTQSFIEYNANLTVSSGDILQQLKDLQALTGNRVHSSGFNYLRSFQNSNNSQANLVSSVTFPVLATLSTDTTTLDDYREVSDFVPVVTGNGGTVSAATCRYTKIGNLVNFTIQLTTQNFTSTQGTTKVSLPHTQVVGSVAQFINNQNYSGGVALIASQAVNLPTLPAQGSVATIYITGQYMTAQ